MLAVIVGSSLSRAITGGAPFGATLAATASLVALHTALAYGALWAHPLSDWRKGRPARLIREGLVDAKPMRRHALGTGDLAQALRRAGVTTPDDVEAAALERNGDISVILRRE